MQLRGSKKIAGGLALAGTLLLGGAVGFAQQTNTQGQERGGRQWEQRGEGRGGRHGKEGFGGHERGLFGGRFAEQLNLTDAQKEQMRQIAERFRESTRTLREQARAAGREHRGFDFNGTFNEAAVRAAAQARANAQVELEVARARMMSEMYNVLTAEQKAQLAAQRQQWEQRRQEFRNRRQQSDTQQQ